MQTKIFNNIRFGAAYNTIANPIKQITQIKGDNKMNDSNLTAQGRETLERFKMEAASEVGVNLKNGYNGDLTAREAGSIGGQMVKKMIDSYKAGNRS